MSDNGPEVGMLPALVLFVELIPLPLRGPLSKGKENGLIFLKSGLYLRGLSLIKHFFIFVWIFFCIPWSMRLGQSLKPQSHKNLLTEVAEND